MKLFSFFQRIRHDPVAAAIEGEDLSYRFNDLKARELAFACIKNQIANSISKCELKVYEKGKSVKNDLWYALNVQPNTNQNACEFWNKFVNTLYDKNEVLVIKENGQYFVADHYDYVHDTALYSHYFKNVQIEGLVYTKYFQMNEVWFCKLNNKKISQLLEQTTEIFNELMESAKTTYTTSNGRKGLLKIDQFAKNQDQKQEKFKKVIGVDFKNFFNASNAVLTLPKGYEYEELPQGARVDTRDIRKIYDDVIELTAMAFGYPRSLLTGDVQDTTKAIDQLLTFVIDPLVKLIETEINRKEYLPEYFMQGKGSVKFDTKAIKHIDLLDVATSVEKLISSGCFCINDIRRVCGEDPIDEDWANQFFMTKNFSTIEELMNAMEGGKTDEKGNNATT